MNKFRPLYVYVQCTLKNVQALKNNCYLFYAMSQGELQPLLWYTSLFYEAFEPENESELVPRLKTFCDK